MSYSSSCYGQRENTATFTCALFVILKCSCKFVLQYEQQIPQPWIDHVFEEKTWPISWPLCCPGFISSVICIFHQQHFGSAWVIFRILLSCLICIIASDWLERLDSLLMGTLRHTHSLTHSVTRLLYFLCCKCAGHFCVSRVIYEE